MLCLGIPVIQLGEAQVMQVDVAGSEKAPLISGVDTTELSALQRQESEFLPIFQYLEEGVLPKNEKHARRLILERPHFSIIEGVLHYENPDLPGLTRIAFPSGLQQKLLQEAHAGRFAGHFADRKIYTSLRKRYWWDNMRADVRHFCHSRLTCATRKGPGRKVRPL